jgi:O-antigen/teichoic acid export membrane protein
MISLITVATSAIGTVLYPTLKSSNRDLLIKSFEKLVMIFSAFVCLCILVYFPLCKFVNVFFADQTKYIESLPVFRVILPSLVFSCTLAVIIHTYYKTFELNTIYFFIVIGALAMSIAANFVAYYFWSTTEAISFASVIITAIWYFVSVVLLAKKIQIKWLKTGLYMFTMVLIFYIVAFLIDIWWLGLIVYFVSYLIITFIYNYKYIVNKLVRKEIISHENFKANDESFKKESNEKNI